MNTRYDTVDRTSRNFSMKLLSKNERLNDTRYSFRETLTGLERRGSGITGIEGSNTFCRYLRQEEYIDIDIKGEVKLEVIFLMYRIFHKD